MLGVSSSNDPAVSPFPTALKGKQCLVPVRHPPTPSRPMHFGDVSEAKLAQIT